MAQPDPYSRLTRFTGTEAGKATAQLGVNLDKEFDEARLTIEQTRTNLGIIQRDDTKLANKTVHAEALDDTVLALLDAGAFSLNGSWSIGKVLAVGNIVEYSGALYLALTAHTAADFTADLAAKKIIGPIFDPDQVSGLAALLASTSGAAQVGTAGGVTVEAALALKASLSALSASSGSTLFSFLQAGTGATSRTGQSKLRDVVSPEDFGAIGDGVTDDTVALLAALQSGRAVDGGFRTYAINGSLTPSSLKALRNIKLVQIANKSGSNYRLLNLVGLSDFTIENLLIDLGSGITTLYNDDAAGGLYIGGVDQNTYAERFHVRNVRVTGNGCGTGIHVRHAKRFSITDCIVHDRIAGSSPDPTNDCQNGIEIFNCANFTLANCQVYNLQTRLSGVPTYKWNRGFVFVEIRDCAIIGCHATSTDQGFDFSGAYDAVNGYIGNRRFTVSGCTANNTVSNGFKCANVTRDALFTGCLVNNVGQIGFVISPSAVALPGGLEKYNTQNIDYVGCKVVNVLGTGWASPGAAQGFRIMSNGLYPSYPRGIRLKDCHVLDNQNTPTTVTAFVSDAAPLEYNVAGYNSDTANYMVGCSSTNVATHTSGIGPLLAVITGSTTQSIPNSTWTTAAWDVDLNDAAGLHNPASSNTGIYIKTSGFYRVTANLVFAANATGARQGRIVINGSALDRTLSGVVGSAAVDTSVQVSITTFLAAGSVVTIELFQNSSAALNFKANESHFAVHKVD